MTDLRSALVNNAYLGCLLVKFDLHKSIFLTAHELKNQIDTCADNLRALVDQKYLTIGSYILTQSEEDGDGQSPLQQMEVPKILGDVLEALIGAVFLDSGRSLDAVWKIIYGLMEKELNEFVRDIPKNPIRRIYEADPGHKFFGKKKPDDDSGSYTIKLLFKNKQYTGTGRSTRFAKLHAAMTALTDVTE
jgi:endoribonuclease Dicer